MRVRVFRNIRSKCWSIETKGSIRRVVASADSVILDNCTLHVSAKGREYSLTKRHQSDHAWIDGDMVAFLPITIHPSTPLIVPGSLLVIDYLIDKNESFVYRGSKCPVTEGKRVVLSSEIFIQESAA